MKILIIKYFLVAFLFMTPFSAKAEDRLLNLWPNQRANYVVKSQENAAKYEARGKDYVEHTLTTGGEVPIEPADDFMNEGQPEIDPVPVDIHQVSKMVEKTEGAVIEDPSKSPVAAQ